ncbi:MAG: hypothetical protein U0228_22875 [Myxococcaceae bacterium]
MLSLAAALLVAASSGAAPSPWLDDARALVAKLQFAEAIERLEVARKVPGVDREGQRAVLELLGYCQVAEGRREDAEATFVALLQLDASAELGKDVASPKVVEAFEAARKRHFPADYVRFEEKTAPAGRVVFDLIDPWKQVTDVVLFTRRDGGEWTEAVLEGPRSFSFAVVVAPGGKLEWRVEARAGERVAATIATEAQPRLVEVARIDTSAEVLAPASSPRPSRVVGVVLLGLGVAAAAIGTGLEVGGWNQRLAARDRSRPPGDFASTALAADQAGASQQAVGVGLFIGAGLAVGTGVVLAW